jgi:putative aminopeptidase FrvX
MPSSRSKRISIADRLCRLAEADGPPGREGTLRRLVEKDLHASMGKVRVSPLGSVYAERRSGRGMRLLVSAHMDEAGFVVSHLDRQGFAWLHPAGEVNAEACSGAAIRFAAGLLAMLGVVPRPAGRGEGLPRLLADFGTGSIDHHLRTGSMGVFATPFEVDGTTIRGKALDGRVGAALALHAAGLSKRAGNTLVLGMTVLGQVGQRAAQAAAFDLEPEAAITLGVLPTDGKRSPGCTAVRPGRGPVILIRSSRFVADAWLVEALVHTAARARLPHQIAVAAENPTGAGAIQASQEGIPTATILVAGTGIGTPRQSVESQDLEAATELLVRLLERPLVPPKVS